jgi:glycosyltransferase involved in cell wall biosynthesis
MSDVTALVLSLGEDYTERAISSVRRQSLPPAETIVVRGISPFHRAFNTALSRVRTEFFIQVDADMILDDTCVEKLREFMSDGVGSVVGCLRDPLLGRIVGIKLFRTRCFDYVNLRDSLSSETDFVGDSLKDGWTTIYARKYLGDWSTFGEHRPDYNPHYTFCKFMRDGAKARYRKSGRGLRRVFRRLQTSGHKAAKIAAIAAAHGVFTKEIRDLHGPCVRSEEFEFLERFLLAPEEGENATALPEKLLRGNLEKGFKRFYELGIQLRRHYAPSTFKTQMRRRQQGHGIASWVALVGLCHGLFVDAYDDAEAAEAFALLKDLLPTWHLSFRY